MTPDLFLTIAFSIMIALLAAMVLVGIPRGKRMQQTNEAIEANQRKQLELAERQTQAVERIAEALEKRG